MIFLQWSDTLPIGFPLLLRWCSYNGPIRFLLVVLCCLDDVPTMVRYASCLRWCVSRYVHQFLEVTFSYVELLYPAWKFSWAGILIEVYYSCFRFWWYDLQYISFYYMNLLSYLLISVGIDFILHAGSSMGYWLIDFGCSLHWCFYLCQSALVLLHYSLYVLFYSCFIALRFLCRLIFLRFLCRLIILRFLCFLNLPWHLLPLQLLFLLLLM